MKIDATLKTATRGAILLSAFASIVFASRVARADDPQWVDRKMTLAPLVIAADGELGFGHWSATVPAPNGCAGCTTTNGGLGPGLSLDGVIGIIPHFEAGLHLGANFGDDAKASNAEGYGRLYDLQTFNAGGDTFTNPEAWARYEFLDLDAVEVGGEARIILPFDAHTALGIMAGLPVAFHMPGVLRFDTGAYFGLAFYDSTVVYFHVPAQAWFQINDKLFLGPLTGLTVAQFAAGNQTQTNTSIGLGFGIGYTVIPALDIKVLPIFWPGINNDDGLGNFGFSAGIQYRIDALANR